MSPPDNPRILQDTDWQTPAGEIVQILKDRLDDIVNFCREGSEDSVRGIIQDTATTYTSLKELEVQRSQMPEQIRQHKETWTKAISSRQGELKQLDERFETAAQRTREKETEYDLADSQAQQNKSILEVRNRALVDIGKVLCQRREEQQQATKRLTDTNIEIESCREVLEVEQADFAQEKRLLELEKKRLDTEAQANRDAKVRMERWARDLRDREAQEVANKVKNERAEAENEDDSRRLSAAISALQQIFFVTDVAVNPTASAPESLAAIEPLEKAIRQQHQRLLDTKVRATDALTALNDKFDIQRDELNSTRRELGAATSENKRLTDDLIRQDHNVSDLEAFEKMAQPIVAGEARLKEEERLWREEANRLSGKVENINKGLTIAQRDRAAFQARSELLQASHDTLQNKAEDQAQLQRELANTQAQLQQKLADTQAQLAFKNKESDAEIRALNGKFKSLQSIASERLAMLSTLSGVYEENKQLKESEVSLQSSLEAKSCELLAKSSRLIAVQQSLTSSRRSIDGLRDSIRSFEGTLKTSEENNGSLHKETRELNLQVSDLHRQIAEKVSATQALANQLEDVEISLVTAERAQTHLQSELDKLKDEQKDLEEEQQEYYSTNSRLGTERDEQVAANKDLQDEVYDLRKRIRNINHRPSTVADQARIEPVSTDNQQVIGNLSRTSEPLSNTLLHGSEAAGPSNIAVWQPAANPAAVIPNKRGFDQMAAPDTLAQTVSAGRSYMGTSRESTVLPSIEIGGHTAGLAMNVAARRLRTPRTPGLAVGPVLAIGSIRDPMFTTSSVPVPVLARLRAQIQDWDAVDTIWESSNPRGRKCTDARINRRGSDWYDGDDKHACKTCTEAGHVCGIARDGGIEILPLRGEAAQALGPLEVGYWMLGTLA